jgi:hypothetical protein
MNSNNTKKTSEYDCLHRNLRLGLPEIASLLLARQFSTSMDNRGAGRLHVGREKTSPMATPITLSREELEALANDWNDRICPLVVAECDNATDDLRVFAIRIVREHQTRIFCGRGDGTFGRVYCGRSEVALPIRWGYHRRGTSPALGRLWAIARWFRLTGDGGAPT